MTIHLPILDQFTTQEQLLSQPKHVIDLYATSVMDLHGITDWNKFNRLNSAGANQDLPAFKKIIKIPSRELKYKSWYEYWLYEIGPFRSAEYEPQEHVLRYCIYRTFTPDTVSRLNPNVFFEPKGFLRDVGEAQKYIHISKQYGKHFIFVLQHKDIQLPWCKPRKDGSIRTIEEWCDANGFTYVYWWNLDEFLRSDRYRQILVEVPRPVKVEMPEPEEDLDALIAEAEADIMERQKRLAVLRTMAKTRAAS